MTKDNMKKIVTTRIVIIVLAILCFLPTAKAEFVTPVSVTALHEVSWAVTSNLIESASDTSYVAPNPGSGGGGTSAWTSENTNTYTFNLDSTYTLNEIHIWDYYTHSPTGWELNFFNGANASGTNLGSTAFNIAPVVCNPSCSTLHTVPFANVANVRSVTLTNTNTSEAGGVGLAEVHFESVAPNNIQAEAEYRFDERQYDDVDDEVIDSIGGLNGRAKGAQTVAGKICNAVDLRPTDINDYIILDENILSNKTDFSVSLWVNSSKTSNQSLLSGAAASGSPNELIMWFDSDKQFRPFFQNQTGGTVNIDSIADDTWRHLVWTRSGSQNCLYRDAILQGCVTGSTSAVSIASLILGQEQDDVGGGFDASQAFDGLVDELLVFDEAISATEVAQIYTNQDGGLNYDGSARSCTILPLLDYRFDECSYTGVAGEVIDQTGNFNASSIGVPSPIDDAILNKSLDLSADSASDWISVPSGVVDGLDDFTVSLWFKTEVTKSQQAILHALGSSASDDELKISLKDGTRVIIEVRNRSRNLNSNVPLTNNAWHHLALTRVDQDICLFIDGAEQQCKGNSESGVLSVNNADAIVIGQKQKNYGGDFNTNPDFEGQLDEFKIYDTELSESEIQGIYLSELAGNNYDGSARDAVVCDNICGIDTGTLNAVGIKIGGGGSNTQINNTTEALTIHAAWLAAGSPASGSIAGGTYNVSASGSNTVDRIDFGGSDNDFVPTLPYPGAANGVQGDDFLVHTSGTLSLPAGDYTIFVESDDGFSFVMDTLSGDAVVFDKNRDSASEDNELRFETPTGNSNTRGWFTLNQDSVFEIAAIFFERGGSDFIEVSIANDTLTDNPPSGYEILSEGALGGKVKFGVCANASQINHYQIIHDGQGLTCDAETVTINACTNAYDGSCSLSDEFVTLDVKAAGSSVIIDSIMLTGSGTATIPYTLAESVVLSLENASTAAANPTVCFDGSATSCNMLFADAGFRFLNASSGTSDIITNQIAGTTFPLRLQAVQNSNGVCAGLFTGNQDINLSQENVDPGGNGGLSFSVNGNNIGKHPSTTSTTLNFGTDSIAVIPTPIYNDAGQIRLHADYNVGGITLSGSSNNFWVSPAELVVTAQFGAATLNGATAAATPTHKAGENFDLTVKAFNSLGVITPNYSPGQVQFSLARTGPTLGGSVDGNLTYALASTLLTSTSPIFQNVTVSSFFSGVSTYNAAHYSEVGLLNLDVQDSNYGNASIVVPATPINIGRFIPDHFKQTIADNGLLLATCNTGTAFAYSGQKDEATDSIGAISYLTNPILAITAYNKQDIVTQNYYEDSQGSVNDFMKLSASNISITAPTFDRAALGVDGAVLPLTANMNNGTLSQNDLTALPGFAALPRGVLHYQLSDADNFFYNRSANALVAPFTSDINFSVNAIADADTVNMTPSDINILPTTVDALPTGVEIRFGRLILENSFGPETSNFPQPMQLEHFDGNVFITSTNNNCVSYDASKMALTNISLDPALTAVLGGTGGFIAGKTQAIELQATGAGNQGQIGVSYEAYDWLQYDWDNDGVYDNDPSAVATFGIFRGNDRIIHWREVFNE
ncbi:MAG: MSHA biogenesis protein MshQ [Glaciecola sp.]|jgi:MSHA biogenesis protein MshQ